MTFRDHLITIRQARENLLSSIETEFSKIPQNLAITQSSENPRCFTIGSSAIAMEKNYILDPFYYNFSAQKDVLCGIVRSTCSLEAILNKLATIAKTGRMGALRFNPVVVGYTKDIVDQCSLVLGE